MRSIRFTPEARADLDDIIAYTLERYGVNQAQSYRGGFKKFFDMLAEHSQIGADQSGIQVGLRRIVYQAHAIYYRVEGCEIVVARILGPGQDPLEEM